MRPTTLKLIIYIAFTIWFCSCTTYKAITGEITDVSGRVVECKGKRFILLQNAPNAVVGDKVTFKPTRNKKDRRINCKLIK